MCGCNGTQGVGQQQGAQQTRQAQETQRTSPTQEAMKNKGQLDPNQLQNYLQQKAQGAAQGAQAFDARMLAESMKAQGVGAST